MGLEEKQWKAHVSAWVAARKLRDLPGVVGRMNALPGASEDNGNDEHDDDENHLTAELLRPHLCL